MSTAAVNIELIQTQKTKNSYFN